MRPSNSPSSTFSQIPSHLPSQDPSSVPSFRPSNYPTLSLSTFLSNSPSSTPSKFPLRLQTDDQSSFPSPLPSSYSTLSLPTSLSNNPSFTTSQIPSYLPTDDPSSVFSALPSNYPTLSPSTLLSSIPRSSLPDSCQLSTTGFYGSETTNIIPITYNYKIEYLNTFLISEMLQDLEYAINGLIVESIFPECSTSRMPSQSGQIELENIIKGISSNPEDIVTDENCVPDNDDGIDCRVMNGSITLHVLNIRRRLQSSPTIETEVLNLISDGMESGELALSHRAIVILTYIPEANQTIPRVNDIEQAQVVSTTVWILMSCATLFFLVTVGYIRRIVVSKKLKETPASDSSCSIEGSYHNEAEGSWLNCISY